MHPFVLDIYNNITKPRIKETSTQQKRQEFDPKWEKFNRYKNMKKCTYKPQGLAQVV